MKSKLSRRHFVEHSALTAGLMGMAGLAAAQDEGPPPSTAITPVDFRRYGAKGDGKSDDTKAMQTALDAARSRRPICLMPSGLFRVEGALTVPPGVTLCGSSGGVPHSEQPIGTVVLAYGGRGQAGGEPLITLKPNAVVRNLVIHYPEQTLAEVAAYPWTIRVDGELCQVLELTITNPYQAIDLGSNCGFWDTETTQEQVRHEGPSTLVLTSCHFTGWDHGKKSDPCIRSSGGRLVVNGCEFMDEGKRPLVLEKGLKAASIFGCAFRSGKGVENVSASGADVQVGLNTMV